MIETKAEQINNDYFSSIKGYGSRYIVTICGKIFCRINNRFLAQNLHTKGYLKSDLWKPVTKKKVNDFVHRIVAKTFLANPQRKKQVNHLSGNKTVNHVYNTEWVTNQENQDHAYRIGLRKKANAN